MIVKLRQTKQVATSISLCTTNTDLHEIVCALPFKSRDTAARSSAPLGHSSLHIARPVCACLYVYVYAWFVIDTKGACVRSLKLSAPPHQSTEDVIDEGGRLAQRSYYNTKPVQQ
jgi:hypothetical protein